MRKRIVDIRGVTGSPESEGEWLDLEQIATVEVTSEDPNFPVESALVPTGGPGWRASSAGEQRIRILFDEPVSLRHVELRFEEAGVERTQEFTLAWIPASGDSEREIVRQQWTFSPAGSTVEVERYAVNAEMVAVLQLTIRPDVGGGPAVATLAGLRLG